MDKDNLLPYIAPQMEVEIIELEQGIASGSAFVSPQAEDAFVKEEWKEESTQTYELNW